MADTYTNNTLRREADAGSAMAGWVVALLVIAGLILAAMYVLPRLATPAASPSTDINLSLPEAQIPAAMPGTGVQNQNTTPGSGSVNDSTLTP